MIRLESVKDHISNGWYEEHKTPQREAFEKWLDDEAEEWLRSSHFEVENQLLNYDNGRAALRRACEVFGRTFIDCTALWSFNYTIDEIEIGDTVGRAFDRHEIDVSGIIFLAVAGLGEYPESETGVALGAVWEKISFEQLFEDHVWGCDDE